MLMCDLEGVAEGMTGAIVYKYDDNLCEIEYFDDEGDTIEIVTTPVDILHV